MRPVNLIPLEDRRGDHAPLRAGVASYAIVGVLAVALIGVILVVLTGNSITESEGELASLEARKAQADLAASSLAPYDQFATLAQTRNATVNSLAKSRFDWERVLNEFALVIPERVTIESLTGTVAAASSAATASGTTDSSVVGPSLQIGGCAEGQKGVARLLAALRDIDGVTRVGMQSSELGDETTAAAPTTTGDEAGTDNGSCLTGPEVAEFQITVAFDAVPTAVPPATGAAPATPAAVTETPTETATTTATDDGGVAETQATEQSAVDSAGKQTSDAHDGASAVGVGD